MDYYSLIIEFMCPIIPISIYRYSKIYMIIHYPDTLDKTELLKPYIVSTPGQMSEHLFPIMWMNAGYVVGINLVNTDLTLRARSNKSAALTEDLLKHDTKRQKNKFSDL